MRTIIVTASPTHEGKIILGRQGENEARQLVLQCQKFFDFFGPGYPVVVYKRPIDTAPYLLPSEKTGDTEWRCTITNADTQYTGVGKIEIRWMLENGGVGKSAIYDTLVMESMKETEQEPPELLKDWYDAMIEYIDTINADTTSEAKQAAASAKESAQQAEISCEQTFEYTDEAKAASTTAKEQADIAKKKATDAEASAYSSLQSKESALESAGIAKSSADTAKTYAHDAEVSTDIALGYVDTVKGYADDINTLVDEAREYSENANQQAEITMENATTAKRHADSALESKNQANQSATNAASSARQADSSYRAALANKELTDVNASAAQSSATRAEQARNSAQTALTQLQQGIANGDFKGDPGKDGVGIQSVVQTTTSTASGGKNVITVTKTDGSTSKFNIFNGYDGKNGHAPVKGTDYWTDEDRASIIEDVINNDVASKDEVELLNQDVQNIYKYFKYNDDNAISVGINATASGIDSFAGCGSSKAIGQASAAFGSGIASGHSSAAFGTGNKNYGYPEAKGNASFAGGYSTLANQSYSHAEGVFSIANGGASFVIGEANKADGAYSFVSGSGNISTGRSSNVRGVNNIPDDSENVEKGTVTYFKSDGSEAVTTTIKLKRYAEIVGNGTSNENRSNAYTLDWDGNAWYQGDVYVGGSSQEDGVKLLKETDIDIKLDKPVGTPTVGQVLMVKSVNADGTFVCEWADNVVRLG